MNIVRRKNENLLIKEFISFFKKIQIKKRKKNTRLTFVLTGGTSPINLYKELSKIKIDWSNVDFFFSDERYVSNKSKNSNYNLAYNLLFKKIKIKKKNIFLIDTNFENINESAKNYEKVVKKYFYQKKIKFDLCLLGMGIDGHIASIFPKSAELQQKFIVKPVYRNDFNRITLGLNIINNSKRIILWLNNKNKTSVFKKLKKKGKKVPFNNLKKNKVSYYSII